VIFFTDENFIHKAAQMLKAFDDRHEVRPFMDCFARATPDEVWIPQVGAWDPKPVIVGGDGRILTNRVQRQLLRESGCIYVHLASGWTNTPWETYAWKLIKYWPVVLKRTIAARHQTVLVLRTTGVIDRINLAG
jgi:hypothetical protein